MSTDYTNEQRLKENIRISSISEFNRILGGMSNSQILSFDDPINEANIGLETQDNLNQILQSSANGTYFINDIIHHILDNDDKNDILIYNEGSVSSQPRVQADRISDALTDVNVVFNKVQKKVKEKNIDGYGWNVGKGGIPAVVNKQSSNDQLPDKINNPRISALTFLEGRFSVPTRGSNEINLFFNGIPTLEMSKCVPYLNLTILYGHAKNEKENMSLGSFLRFVKNKDGNLVVDESIGLNDSKKYLDASNSDDFIKKQSIFDSQDKSKDSGTSSSGIELFLSPQTLSNANINNEEHGENILEPIMPLMTLESFNVSIQGLGYGLYASKNASLKIHLHDRSRLKDIAPLVSPQQFGQTKFIIEYGWSHPDGNANSNNPIGQFLNSLRDIGIFTVASTKMDFSGQGASIDIRMAMQGGDDSNAISIACGKFVQGKIFKPQVESILNNIIKKINPDNYSKSQLKEIRKKHNLSIGEVSSTRSIVHYSDYLELLNYAGLSKQDRDDEQFLNKIKSIFKIDEYSDPSEESEKKEGFQPSESGIRLTEAIGSKIQSLHVLNDPFINETIKAQNKNISISTLVNNVGFFPDDAFNDVFGAVSGFKGYHQGETAHKEITTLGTLILKFVAEPLSTTGRYDEIQVCFYKMNNQSAGARIYSTASFPIVIDHFRTAMSDSIFKNPNITVNRFLRILDSKIINNFENPAYGLSEQMSLKNKRRKFSYKALKGMTNAEIAVLGLPEEFSSIRNNLKDKKEITEKEKDLFSHWREKLIDDSSKSITNKLDLIYKTDGSGDFIGEAKFVIPDLGVYYESLPAIKPAKGKGNNRAESEYENKTILRIHVYDKNYTPHPELLYYQDLMTDDSISTSLKNKSLPTGKKASEKVMSLSAKDIKNSIKKKMPSITYGAAFNNVTNLTLNGMSTSGGSIGNTLFLTALQNKDAPQSGHGGVSDIDDMQVMPMEASIKCLGIPLLTRGNQLYIDMNSNTTADNMYAVRNVSHTISAGNFTTDASLLFVAQNSIKDIRSKIMTAAKSIEKTINNSTNNDYPESSQIEENVLEEAYKFKFKHRLKN